MERLTGNTRNFDGTGFAMESLVNDNGILTDFTDKVLTKLADYEDAEEQGLILRLPCPIGSTIWFVGNEFVNDYEVRRYIVDETGIDCVQIAKEIDGRDYWNSFSIDDIGKTIFLTKEEAELALKDMQEV